MVLPQQLGPWMHSVRSHARTAAPRTSRGRRMADRHPGRAGGSCTKGGGEESEGGQRTCCAHIVDIHAPSDAEPPATH